MSKTNKLTPRQWRVYNFYIAQGAEDWTAQIDVVAYFSMLYPKILDGQLFHNSTARLELTKDIRAINECPTIQKVIISGPLGNKVATEEEYERYVFNEYYSTLARLQRCRKKIKKGRMNGQFRIALGREREVIESFLKNDGGRKNA